MDLASPEARLLIRRDAGQFPPIPPPPEVRLAGVVLSDNGDHDGWADTNETVQMRIRLRNRYGIELTGVVAHLTTQDPRIACISRPTLDVGSLAANDIALSTAAFEFLVGDVDRAAVSEDFTAAFSIRLSSLELGELPEQSLVLDLDLDAGGGSGSTTFFEGFEGGLGSFTTLHLDADLNPPDSDIGNNEAGVENADGYRCQYSDPDWEGSNISGSAAQRCYPNPTARPDAFWWDTSADRAFTGMRSIYFGTFIASAFEYTTPQAQLEAIALDEPIHVDWHKRCEDTKEIACVDDIECPPGEACVPATPTMTFKHQVRFLDHESIGGGQGDRGDDRGIVQVQLADAAGTPVGDWLLIDPLINPYDTLPNTLHLNCFFDPTDDGNTEQDFFDPGDPLRRFGPSSTCFPRRAFVHQGETELLFDPNNVGDAADGPGLAGESGPGTWVDVHIDLSRFLGRSIRLRFLTTGVKVSGDVTWYDWGLHDLPGDDGWWIDDVTVTHTLTTPATVTVDGADNLDIKDDGDLDGVGAVCDCDPGDESVWMLPGEVAGLVLSHAGGAAGATTLAWEPPSAPGAVAVHYDVLRSASPGDFDGATCLGANVDGPMATETMTPDPGAVWHYLVRARHGCGAGPVGSTSAGVARSAVGCP